MAQFNAKKAVKKELWTGKEVGQAYFYNLASQIDKTLPKLPAEVIVDRASKLDEVQFKIYRQYMTAYDWITHEFALAQAVLYHAKSEILTEISELSHIDRAHKERNDIYKTPIIYNEEAREQAHQHNIKSRLESTRTFTAADIAALFVLSHYKGKLPSRAEFLFTGYNTETEPEVDELEQECLINLEAALDDIAETIAERISDDEARNIKLSLQEEIYSGTKCPEWTKHREGFSELLERISTEPIKEYSFKTLFYMDFLGFRKLMWEACNPLTRSPRYYTAHAIKPTAKGEGEAANVSILKNGGIIDNMARKNSLEYLQKHSIETLGDMAEYRNGIINADIETLRQFNEIVEAISRCIEVSEILNYKRDLGYLLAPAADLNILIVDIKANAIQGYSLQEAKGTSGAARSHYIYTDEAESSKSKAAAFGLKPLELEPAKKYPPEISERLDKAFTDLSIFNGASSKVYRLFDEGAND